MTTTDKNTQWYLHRSLFRSCCAVTAAACLAMLLSACSSTPDGAPEASEEPQVVEQDVADAGGPGDQAARSEDLEYNLNRLDDPDYTQTYGDGENEKVWYSAAENLGEIGKPAIPHLIEKLDSADEFEVMLALYALQLASQDAQLQAQTEQNYLSLPSVLNPRANDRNKAIALSWWQQYRHLWESSNE